MIAGFLRGWGLAPVIVAMGSFETAILLLHCILACQTLALEQPFRFAAKAYNTSGSTVEGKINVHLVSHTHDDVGWLKTVDQYYVGSNNSIAVGDCHEFLLTVAFFVWVLGWCDLIYHTDDYTKIAKKW